jgi:hypothetical protein
MLLITGTRERPGINFISYLKWEKAMKKRFLTVYGLILVGLVLIDTTVAPAAYVTPRIGGAQRMHTVAPMIMPEINFDGTNVTVLDEMGNDWVTLEGNARPVMWPLQGTDQFEPGKPWYSALNGKAYNWQYGWTVADNLSGMLPAGGWVWIEESSQSEGLDVYDRYANSYAPIFGAAGSSNIWKWNENQTMAHNAYTVTPQYAEWSVNYRIYIGDITTGADMGYGSDIVTLTWASVPEPATLTLMGMGIVSLLVKKRARGSK